MMRPRRGGGGCEHRNFLTRNKNNSNSRITLLWFLRSSLFLILLNCDDTYGYGPNNNSPYYSHHGLQQREQHNQKKNKSILKNEEPENENDKHEDPSDLKLNVNDSSNRNSNKSKGFKKKKVVNDETTTVELLTLLSVVGENNDEVIQVRKGDADVVLSTNKIVLALTAPSMAPSLLLRREARNGDANVVSSTNKIILASAAPTMAPSLLSRREKKTEIQLHLQERLQQANNGDNKNNDKNNNKNNETPAPTRAETGAPTKFPTKLPTKRPTDAPTQTPVLQIENVQSYGGGELTLRFSLWFKDATRAKDIVGGDVELAVWKGLERLLCETSADVQAKVMVSDFESTEMCILSPSLKANRKLQDYDDSTIVLIPPISYIVDRSEGDDLQWTTWRLAWSVVRLGGIYVQQALSNLDNDERNSGIEQLYMSSVRANQQLLDVGFQQTIQDGGLDKVIREALQPNLNAVVESADTNAITIKSSLYGEEVQTFEPLVRFAATPEVVVVAPNNDSPENTGDAVAESGGAAAESNGNNVRDVDDFMMRDDAYPDDDRYSVTYGITEPVTPEPFHALRLVGFGMMILTSIVFFLLIRTSRRRREERESKLQKIEDGHGLLTSHVGVEEMLESSRRGERAIQSKIPSGDGVGKFMTPDFFQDNNNSPSVLGKMVDVDDDDDETNDQVVIPMPETLHRITSRRFSFK